MLPLNRLRSSQQPFGMAHTDMLWWMDTLCEARPISFFSLGRVVAFGDNSGYGAWKQPMEPAQIDTQAVVRLWVSSTTVFFMDWARMGRYAE